ncbi:MAG: hypothetical protein QOK31_2077 [Solirubrobacteraceae bacterium]|jgi:hypothetical protein|nr:hypothetical protein [Solirubrobacteraceae bacterium]
MAELLRLGGHTMSTARAREAKAENSKAQRDIRPAGAVRLGVLALAAAGLILLVVAEFSTLLRVETGVGNESVLKTVTTGSHHAYAQVLLALVAAVFTFGAVVRASRPALIALAVIGVTSLAISFLRDLPDTNRSGSISQKLEIRFDAAHTVRGSGLYLEMLGGALLIIAGGGGLLLARQEAPPGERRRREGPAAESRPEPRSRSPRADGSKPRATKPRSAKPRSAKPRSTKPRSTTPRSTKPRSTKPRSTPQRDPGKGSAEGGDPNSA